MKKPKIFIACDTTSLTKVKDIIKQSKTNKIKIGYKFGLEFMNSKNGRQFVSKLKNKIIFVDLKLNDTVNTMLSAVKALKDLKINYLTVHISSGLAALKAVKKISGSTKIIGVTTLTSLNNKDLKLIGYNKSVKNLVSQQARLAKKASLDALVCSPYEVKAVRKIFKKEIITPGVQIGKKNYDQKRSMEAKKVKSDWLVIGRAITQGNIKKNIQNLFTELR
jgi:orotidine-5'-phosphate decarboxylase